jgi:phosphate-selective porin OprO/OprP
MTSTVSATVLALVVLAPPALAQTAPPAAQPAPPASGWRDGFVLQSEKGDFRLQIGVLLHADTRFAWGDDDPQVNDTFLIRRARPSLRGRIGQRFEFVLTPDFAGGTLVLQDAYFDTVFAPAFRLRLGKGKTPFSLERLQSASNILFIERALTASLSPNRDLGVQALGDIRGGLVSYAAAVLNGVADGGSGDLDNSDSKDVAARVVLRPFTARADSALRGLTVGIGATAGRQTGIGPLPTIRTSTSQFAFATYTGASADGVRTRYAPQGSYYYKSFAALAEYVRSELPIAVNGVTADVAHDAWQIAGSWVLTGEAATDASAGIRPRNPFDFGHGHWGAVQIAARYHALAIDERAAQLNLLTAGSSRTADAWTLGLNWVLTQNIKYVFNVERTLFDDKPDGSSRAETAFSFRAQLNF